MKPEFLAEKIKEKVSMLFSEVDKPIPLHAPEFGTLEKDLVVECIETGWVSSVGKFVDEFEDCLAKTCNVKYAVAVVNGTAALELALRIVGVEPGDEVIMPSLTFVATANAARHLGAIPNFVDVSPSSLSMSPIKLNQYLKSILVQKNGLAYNKVTGSKVSAIVPMHTFGHPADMDALLQITNDLNIPIVEDAAESLGSTHNGKACGSLGSVGALSFNGNKIITTGGGGAIVTNNKSLANRARHLATTAKLPHRWNYEHTEVAYNYRLPNINAALGLGQISKLLEKVSEKRIVADKYKIAFLDIDEVDFVIEPSWAKSNYWLNAIKLREPDYEVREEILSSLNDSGFLSRPIWTPLHKLQMFESMPRSNLKTTEELHYSVINLPSSPNLARLVK